MDKGRAVTVFKPEWNAARIAQAEAEWAKANPAAAAAEQRVIQKAAELVIQKPADAVVPKGGQQVSRQTVSTPPPATKAEEPFSPLRRSRKPWEYGTREPEEEARPRWRPSHRVTPRF